MPEIKYNGENTLTRVIEKTIDYVDTKTAPIDSKLNANLKGAANGVAELDSSGKVPSAQLPSYVDDIVDCYYDTETEKLYETKDGNTYSDEITPEGGKIYVDKDSNAAYRWTGSIIASVGSANAITLGETSSTAYRGDRGKIAYDDSQTNKANIGDIENLSTTTKSNLVGAINEVKTEVGEKVDKVTGKGLSTNDYDNTEKTEVAKVKDKQNKTLSSAVTIDGVSKSSVEEAISALATLANTTAAMALNKISIADAFDDTVEYAIGDYCIYDNKLYKAKATHQGAWDADNFNQKQVMDEITDIMVSSYTSLSDLPQIGGTTLIGNKTYSQLGIQQSETGKGLSTNDYDDAAKAIVDGVTAALATKQPKTLETAVTIEGGSKTTVQQVADAVATHTGRSVTDNTGAHGLKVTAVSEDEDAIYYKSGNDWKQIQLGSVTQLAEMPTAAAKYVGKIYQFVGATTESYKKGYFYECINSAGVYAWQSVRVQSGGGQTIQYDPLPTAEASLVGALLQYVGATNENYTRGHFYECVAGTETGTFVWEEVSVADITLTDQDIIDIKTAFIIGLYGNSIPSLSTITIDQLATVLQKYYAGEIPIEAIQAKWSTGDYFNVNLLDIASYNSSVNGRAMVDNGHPAQVIQPMIVAFNHYDLETPIGNNTKALLTVYMKDCLNETGTMMNRDYEHYICGWKNQPRREWCNTNVFNAFPQRLQNIIKPVVRNVQATGSTSGYGDFSQRENVIDTVFFPEAKEVGGKYGGGNPYTYFISNARRIKKVNSQESTYWLGNDGNVLRDDTYMCKQAAITNSGAIYQDGAGYGIPRISSNTAGLAFAFCL